MKPVKWKLYSVILYVNTLSEATYLVRDISHQSAQTYILTMARTQPEWLGKQLAAESMRVKKKHITRMDKHGFMHE